ncbi:MAG: hypothetical protein GW795_10950 [Cyanobacteria bacterium]|jgi:hypothetical protein|uniref:hypothetical protein n=1 Tax=Geminocystis sp. TaxID=2664100 RepID=UPI0035943FBA|nr:hypothetical protein [Cyanobacteria bacterium CG_2015-16_32_12]NCQ05796.1 hypothetical protein [Cyanobacteria bacterium CG_2015-09_32_10]NCQ42373.1 hypothetical protein [Cyanobacteria bacterium CG_2015-04_32_10]
MTNSENLAKYIESIDGISKPWLLAQIRLKKLEENKPFLSPDEYLKQLKDIHQDVMNLGEWWIEIKN